MQSRNIRFACVRDIVRSAHSEVRPAPSRLAGKTAGPTWEWLTPRHFPLWSEWLVGVVEFVLQSHSSEDLFQVAFHLLEALELGQLPT